MVTVGGKYLIEVDGGKLERYRTITFKKRKFSLYEVIKVTTKNHTVIKGEIFDIYGDSMRILPDHDSSKLVNYKDIENICY